ncbi:MAG: cation:proton antiporter [Burkholderiales bacterium]|nr:cation:proton antiporter [Burkholderiales bacterium]
MQLGYLPQFPPALTQPILFGALLAAGLLVGEAVRRYAALPRITGYVLAGILLGPLAFGLLGPDAIETARVLIDLSIGLIVFELGFRFDLAWLKRNRWLFVAAVAESALCFLAIYFALLYLGFQALHAASAAAIGTATSPAVVMLVAHDQRADGQITERMLLFTAVNSIFAYVGLTLLLPFLRLEHAVNWVHAALHPVYLLVGSVLAGFIACGVMLGLARWVGKREDRQFVLLVALVVLTVGVARALNLSVMVALVVLGMLARNLDRRHVLMPLRAGHGGQLFFVILFVLTGASLEFDALFTASLAVAAFVVARFVGKAAAIYAFSRATGLRRRGAGLLSIALLPMSGLAVVMLHDAQSLVPGLRQELAAVVIASIALLELAGPVATQFALRRAGETRPEPENA